MVSWIIAVGLGASTGLIELVTRYRDEPTALRSSVSFWLYIVLNAAISAGALEFIHVFSWNFGLHAEAPRQAAQVLAAGLAAMALFRSSFIHLKMGGADLDIGPNALLASMLDVVDRSVDRHRAAQRSRLITRIMSGVSFKKASISLSVYCLQLMQNVPLDEQQKLRNAVDAVGVSSMDDDLKTLNLGLLLLNTVGPAVLDAAVHDLGERIRDLSDGAGDVHVAAHGNRGGFRLFHETACSTTYSYETHFSLDFDDPATPAFGAGSGRSPACQWTSASTELTR